MLKKIGYIITYVIIVIINHRIGIIDIPCIADMRDFQINLFTICSVLAGFSFTVLGVLTAILSDKVMEILDNTSIVTNKSELILKSVIAFMIPSVLAILFFTGIIDCISSTTNFLFIRELLFVFQITSLFIGFVFFLRATKGVYNLIKAIYGYNKNKMEKKKDEFDRAAEKASGILNKHRD